MLTQTDLDSAEPTLSQHGTLVALGAGGLLITGPAGSGKSSLALDLIDRGHLLVADDAPLLYTDGTTLLGSCPAGFEGQLHVQGIGLLHLPYHPGEIKVQMAVTLDPQCSNALGTCLLDGLWDNLTIGPVQLPRLRLNPSLCANLAVMAEYCFNQHKERIHSESGA